VQMPAHERRANIAAMRFLRGPAVAMQLKARAELRRVLADALAEAW